MFQLKSYWSCFYQLWFWNKYRVLWQDHWYLLIYLSRRGPFQSSKSSCGCL